MVIRRSLKFLFHNHRHVLPENASGCHDNGETSGLQFIDSADWRDSWKMFEEENQKYRGAICCELMGASKD